MQSNKLSLWDERDSSAELCRLDLFGKDNCSVDDICCCAYEFEMSNFLDIMQRGVDLLHISNKGFSSSLRMKINGDRIMLACFSSSQVLYLLFEDIINVRRGGCQKAPIFGDRRWEPLLFTIEVRDRDEPLVFRTKSCTQMNILVNAINVLLKYYFCDDSTLIRTSRR